MTVSRMFHAARIIEDEDWICSDLQVPVESPDQYSYLTVNFPVRGKWKGLSRILESEWGINWAES